MERAQTPLPCTLNLQHQKSDSHLLSDYSVCVCATLHALQFALDCLCLDLAFAKNKGLGHRGAG